MEKRIIRFKDLSWFLKLAIIGGIIEFSILALGFIIGFLEGLIGIS